jgi:hypothetical protein
MVAMDHCRTESGFGMAMDENAWRIIEQRESMQRCRHDHDGVVAADV